MHIPFVSVVEFKFLTHSLMNHLVVVVVVSLAQLTILSILTHQIPARNEV